MVVQPWWTAWRGRRAGADGRLSWVRQLDRLAAAAAPGIGMLIYSTYILFLTGNPFQWTAEQVAWGRAYRSLVTVVTDRVEYIAEQGLYRYVSMQAIDLMYLLATFFMLAVAWPVYRRFGLPYAMWILANLLPPLATGGLLSMGRMTSVLFPAFLWMAAVLPAHHRTAWVALFACLQGLIAVLFFTWRQVF
jgi:hypothetical protein